ncbi:MAG: molybdate ABC transporter substrate-binding protein [Anaerolineae bacterium]
MRKLIFFLLVLTLALIPAVVTAQDSQTLTVYAASSLTNVFGQIATVFEADHPGVTVEFNFASSSDLAAQLSEGAPADIFASANQRQMNVVIDAERISGDSIVFAHNRLVVIYPADNPAGLTTLADLATPGVQLVIAADGVPVRDYTETMLEQMAADATYGDAFVTGFRANVVSEEANVRQVAAKVALGEADAGLVYFSDITEDIRDSVGYLDIPDAYNTIASYPIAVLDDSTQQDLAIAFIDLILSSAGQQILVDANFIPVCLPQSADTEWTPEPEAALDATPAVDSELDACPA